MTKKPRRAGFYWVAETKDGRLIIRPEWEPGRWDGREWLLTGNDYATSEARLIVGRAIRVPAKEPSAA